MSRVLLADDSRHAQNMGELILREEGFDVVCVGDGEAAVRRLAELDPDIILADAFLPKRSGYELCRQIKNDPRYRHVRVVLTAGVLEPLDETEAARAGSDALLKKPFEASMMIETLKPLAEEAKVARERHHTSRPLEILPGEVDPEAVRAAVTIALDAALPAMVDEITQRVLAALRK